MNLKLYHHWWQSLPATAIVGWMAWNAHKASPLPERIATSFGGDGLPKEYGPAWVGQWMPVGIAVLFVIINVALDESWARSERDGKRFNYVSLIDDATVAFLAALHLAALQAVVRPEPRLEWNGPLMLGLMGGAVAVALLAELARPFRPAPQPPVEDASAFEEELRWRAEQGKVGAYLDHQRSMGMDLLLGLSTVVGLVAASAAMLDEPWVGALVLVCVAPILVFIGGIRTVVSGHGLRVKMGLLGITVAKLSREQIASVQVHQFSPMGDFGGYGIKWSKGIKAVFWKGDRGVLVQTKEGKKLLIGSDRPELLAAATRVLTLGQR